MAKLTAPFELFGITVQSAHLAQNMHRSNLIIVVPDVSFMEYRN